MPERQRGRDPNKKKDTEFVTNDPSLYHLAVHYSNEHSSEDAYDKARQLIHDEPCDLSTYRFMLQPQMLWYVAVLGAPPPPELLRCIEITLLTHGERRVLPDEILHSLRLRRLEQAQRGEWVEYRAPRPRRTKE